MGGKLDYSTVVAEVFHGKHCVTLASGSWGLPAVSRALFEIPAQQQAGTLWCMDTGNQINRQTNSLTAGQTTATTVLRLTGLNCKHANADWRCRNLHEGWSGRDSFDEMKGRVSHFWEVIFGLQHLDVLFFFLAIVTDSSTLWSSPVILTFLSSRTSTLLHHVWTNKEVLLADQRLDWTSSQCQSIFCYFCPPDDFTETFKWIIKL